VQVEDGDKVILLLCALPKSYESFKDTMLYGKEGTVTLEQVQAALRTKELTKSKDLRIHENGEGLSYRIFWPKITPARVLWPCIVSNFSNETSAKRYFIIHHFLVPIQALYSP